MDIDVNWVTAWLSIIMFWFLYTLYERIKAAIERRERMAHQRHKSLIDTLEKINDKLYSINCNLNSIKIGAGAGGQLHGNLRDTASSLKEIQKVTERLLVRSGG